MALIVDPDLLADSTTDAGAVEVFINTATQTIKFNIVGDLSTDGVTEKCIYSFLKEEWKNDPHSKNLAAFDFPMTPITDEFFELVDGWDWANDATRQLLRNGGWLVRNVSGNVTAHYACLKTTGSTESNDQLYYLLDGASGVGSPTNFVLTGPANQGVKIIDDPNGDGAYGDGFSRVTNAKVFNREQAQVYALASTSANGEASLTAPKLFGLDASTGTDLKVAAADASIAANAPYTSIVVRYFATAFSRDVDSATNRSFGIVVDVGTHSGVDGSAPGAASVLTSAEGGMTVNAYSGGVLSIYEGTNENATFPIVSNTATTITVTGTLAVGSGLSFSAQRATPIVASTIQIYEKVQYLLRQNADMDSTTGSVTGKVADQLLEFVGDQLKAKAPTNPNGGGSGVLIQGFSIGDTNSITFKDSGGVDRTYPFVAVFTLNFGPNLVADAAAWYAVYFATLPGAGNDYGESGAVIVKDNDGTDIAGLVSAATSITFSFNYDGNVQGGRTAATDAAVVVKAGGLGTAQAVKTTTTIARSITNSASLVSSLERNYLNP